VRKLDYKALDRRDKISNIMKKTATPFASTQDSNPCSGLTVSVSESLDRLQDQPLARPLPQTEEIDAFTEERTEAVKSRSATDKRLVDPQQQSLSHCSKIHSKIHNFYTRASYCHQRECLTLDESRLMKEVHLTSSRGGLP
jgi:hypothetical protein